MKVYKYTYYTEVTLPKKDINRNILANYKSIIRIPRLHIQIIKTTLKLIKILLMNFL